MNIDWKLPHCGTSNLQEFQSVMEDVADNPGMDMNCTNAQDHVAAAEHNDGTIKETHTKTPTPMMTVKVTKVKTKNAFQTQNNAKVRMTH